MGLSQDGASKRRAFVIVMDACGVGALPDAGQYGDVGTNTLGNLSRALSSGLDLPVLQELGLGSIIDLHGVAPTDDPVYHGRLNPLGAGKDTITGHWELMGVVSPEPMVTYPDGFPQEILDRIQKATGRGILCNQPYSGTEVIDDYGPQHIARGDLIVYTSADSVLQIAAHEEVIPLQELYEACSKAREIMRGEHTVGRVIARPFIGEPGAFKRTPRRKDYAVHPPSRSYLQEIQAADIPVHSVGKIGQVFAQVGIDFEHPGSSNEIAIESTTKLIRELDNGLVFVNLVETDQLYGHRNDVEGFHGALQQIDKSVGEWLKLIDPQNDMLIITADHGCDPTTPGTDHTREYVPLLALFPGAKGKERHDGSFGDVGASVLYWLTGNESNEIPGSPFLALRELASV